LRIREKKEIFKGSWFGNFRSGRGIDFSRSQTITDTRRAEHKKGGEKGDTSTN